MQLTQFTDGRYSIDFNKVSMKPYECKYQNLLLSKSDDEILDVNFSWEPNTYPTLMIKNAKIIVLNRVIKEIIGFKKDIDRAISEQSEKMMKEEE